MTNEFNLSEKIKGGIHNDFENLIEMDDVKEFIKILKDEIRHIYVIEDKFRVDEFDEIIKNINRLAGDKLI